MILRYARWIVAYCFLLSIGLAGVLSQAGKLYAASAPGLLIGISLWTLLLVGGILFLCQRMDKAVAQIRIATATTDQHCARAGEFPRYLESRTRLLGLPLFAMEWGGHRVDRYRPRQVCAWIAVGDTAISPLFAFGGLAVAPVAVGAITVGVLSLSLFGVAAGMFALGSLAFGPMNRNASRPWLSESRRSDSRGGTGCGIRPRRSWRRRCNRHSSLCSHHILMHETPSLRRAAPPSNCVSSCLLPGQPDRLHPIPGRPAPDGTHHGDALHLGAKFFLSGSLADGLPIEEVWERVK